VLSDVSEEHITSIFRVEEISSARNQQASRWKAEELISSTLKMDAICSSETSVDTQRTTPRYIPEVDSIQMMGSCEHGNEFCVSIKGGEFIH
jgi:hypothetical protein